LNQTGSAVSVGDAGRRIPESLKKNALAPFSKGVLFQVRLIFRL